MSQTMNPTIKLTVTGNRTNTADKETASVTLNEAIQLALVNGVGNGQADLLFSDTRTITASSTDSIDLNGALSDSAFGGACNFAKIKAIIIHSKLTANKQLSIGGAAANALASLFGDVSDKIKLDPGGLLVLTNPNTGYAVTADTADILAITNASGGSSEYDIWIFGTSS